MKKVRLWIVAGLMAALVFPAAGLADVRGDLQAVKKAVKENPEYKAGQEVKWFKVLVTDSKTGKDKVKITLPISLVEIFAKCADEKHFRIHGDDCDIDLTALFAELKKVGPMMFVEVYEDDETVKIWLE